MRLTPDRTLLLLGANQALRRLAASAATRAGWRLAPGDQVGADVRAVLIDWNHDAAARIEALRAAHPALPILVVADRMAAVDAIRAGASDIFTRPLGLDRLASALAAAADRRRRRGELRPLSVKISKPLGFGEIVGSAPAFRTALAIAAKAARSRVPVLIEGEAGAGKHVVAQAIHAAGPRAERPLVVFDCAATSAASLESQLFGHEKGAIPGAFTRQAGKIEAADGGTLFLTHVDALPAELQARLLHVVESGEVSRIGARGFKPVDIRFIASANAPLANAVAAGAFREDLFCRLAPVQLAVPPLRARAADIPALARHLLARIAEQPGLPHLGLTDDALALLMGYGWPGNIRQLQNVLFRAAISCRGQALTAADFPQIAHESAFGNRADDYHAAIEAPAPARADAPGISLYAADGHLRPMEEIEADIIRLAIGHYRGRMTEVARRLGIGRSTLYRKLAELGIDSAA